MTRLILGTASLAGIFAAVALGLPSHVTVSRSVVINAPESVIFPYLNNLHKFEDWSPWRVRDPQLAVSYGGPESGQGARVTWSSKKPSVGTGSMEISESQPSRRIDLVVNFNGLTAQVLTTSCPRVREARSYGHSATNPPRTR
jgi:hypothetical protein